MNHRVTRSTAVTGLAPETPAPLRQLSGRFRALAGVSPRAVRSKLFSTVPQYHPYFCASACPHRTGREALVSRVWEVSTLLSHPRGAALEQHPRSRRVLPAGHRPAFTNVLPFLSSMSAALS